MNPQLLEVGEIVQIVLALEDRAKHCQEKIHHHGSTHPDEYYQATSEACTKLAEKIRTHNITLTPLQGKEG